MLVTESAGRLRLVKNGDVTPQALWEVPPPGGRDVLHAVVVHPDFAKNRFVYVSYVKRKDMQLTVAIARGRLEGGRLADAKDIFVADAWETAANALNGRMISVPTGRCTSPSAIAIVSSSATTTASGCGRRISATTSASSCD